MIIRDFFPTAAKEFGEIARAAAATDLTAPTPCSDFDVRTLVNHVIGTTGALATVGRREPLDPEDPYGAKNDATGGDWAGQLVARATTLAEVWSMPDAWDGTVSMAGQELPATLIGEMSMVEMLLHGWDLARASGQQLTVPDDVGRELLRHIDDTAEWGRSVGAYGPAVALEGRQGASAFERALAAAGRDPAWQSSGRQPTAPPTDPTG
jgi:uncharacterized protein (TIGR03086 family)